VGLFNLAVREKRSSWRFECDFLILGQIKMSVCKYIWPIIIGLYAVFNKNLAHCDPALSLENKCRFTIYKNICCRLSTDMFTIPFANRLFFSFSAWVGQSTPANESTAKICAMEHAAKKCVSSGLGSSNREISRFSIATLASTHDHHSRGVFPLSWKFLSTRVFLCAPTSRHTHVRVYIYL